MGQPMVTGFDGKTAWIKQADDVLPCDAGTTKQIKDETEHGLLVLSTLEDPGVVLSLGTPAMVQHKMCPALIVTNQGSATTLYIQPDTGLVVKSQYEGVDIEQGVSTSRSVEYSDYKRIFGSLVPYHMVEFNDTKKSGVTDLITVKVDRSIDDQVFAMPPEWLPERLKAGPVTVPFEFTANEVMVNVKVNDGDPVPFILDTGATQSLLDQQVATRLGVRTHSGYSMTTGSGSIKTDFISAEKLSIGDITLENIAMAVAPLQGFSNIPDPKPGGLLGANILRRFLVSIDYPNRTVTFANPRQVAIPEGAVVLDTKPALGSSGRIVNGDLDGKKLTFLIDTGAAINNMTESQAKSILAVPLLPVGTIEGLDGQKVSIASARFNKLTIDKFEVDNPIFSIAPSSVQKLQPGIISADQLAILGNPLWSRYKLTVDYRTQRIIIEEPDAEKQINAVRSEIGRIQYDCYKTDDIKTAVKALADLAARQEEQKHLAAAALAYASKAFTEAAYIAPTRERILVDSAHKDFARAQQLAEASKNRHVQGRVLCLRGLSSLVNDKPANFTDAKQYVLRAQQFGNTDSTLALVLYFFYKKARVKEKTRELLDQTLMLEPDCWTALWEEYDLAKEEHRAADVDLVLAQLKHYYPEALKVEAALDEAAKSGAGNSDTRAKAEE
ncbi:MAG TPA: retroviral-like aspartic protease family protein, partial [Chroococcales cyanobacterium]